VRALFEQRLLPLASVDAAFVALLAAHVPLVHDARSLFDCLVDRFGKPLRRFIALAPLDERLSGSQRNAIVSRTRAQVCCVLDSWLRHYASDFLVDSELFADSRSCWWQRRRLPTRSRSGTACRRARRRWPFHRKRPAFEASTKKMLKYCGERARSKSRTLLDYHPVEVARQMALAVRADFCARATERADVARLDEARPTRTRATARTSSASSTSSIASAAGWRRK
jgi:hypothetical protein